MCLRGETKTNEASGVRDTSMCPSFTSGSIVRWICIKKKREVLYHYIYKMSAQPLRKPNDHWLKRQKNNNIHWCYNICFPPPQQAPWTVYASDVSLFDPMFCGLLWTVKSVTSGPGRTVGCCCCCSCCGACGCCGDCCCCIEICWLVVVSVVEAGRVISKVALASRSTCEEKL